MSDLRSLKELPKSMKERRSFELFIWRVFSECQEFVGQNYDSIDLPQFMLRIVPTDERFRSEEERASEGVKSKEVAKGQVSAFVVGNKYNATVVLNMERFFEALSTGGYPTFLLFLVETFIQEILHAIFPEKYEQEVWELQCGLVESFLGIKLSKERWNLKASDYYSKA